MRGSSSTGAGPCCTGSTDPPAPGRTAGQEWHQNGRLHRLDGPAMVLPNGMQRWYVDGRLHRADGPAVEMKSGRSWYYLNGRMVSESVLGL